MVDARADRDDAGAGHARRASPRRVDEALIRRASRGQQALATVGAFDLLASRSGARRAGRSRSSSVLLVWSRHAAERALVRAAYVMAALVVLQIALGVSMAYLALTPAAQVAHLTASSLLLGAETVCVCSRAGCRPKP